MKKDFSVRVEAVTLAEELGVKLSRTQIDSVVELVESYDIFLDVVSLLVTRSVQEVAEAGGIVIDEGAINERIKLAKHHIRKDSILSDN